MGKPTGFLDFQRKEPGYRPSAERQHDWNAVERLPTAADVQEQAARCMDCGVPFCHGCGCPLANIIPEWNDLIRTPEQRAKLTSQIEDSVLQIHAYWLPLRQAVAERQTAQAMSTKVGRNEPCPCGSGKKFKKCCGSPADLH